MQNETVLTSKLVRAWKQMNADILNITGSQFQAPGWPDVFVCSKIWAGWIEFKGPKTLLKPHQARVIKKLGQTENIWIVRFTEQINDGWAFEFSDSLLNVVGQYETVGTNGQVAAKLLKRLAEMDA